MASASRHFCKVVAGWASDGLKAQSPRRHPDPEMRNEREATKSVKRLRVRKTEIVFPKLFTQKQLDEMISAG